MADAKSRATDDSPSTRRHFLQRLGEGVAVGGMGRPLLAGAAAASEQAQPEQVACRTLGKSGLRVSEIGFGGHSWSMRKLPDGAGGHRLVSVKEAVEMVRAGLEMGVNFFDSCTPLVESSMPGEALKRLRARDKAIVSIRVSHKMKGNQNDRKEIYAWTEQRLKLWQTDHVDVCLLCNSEDDTPQSGYWDMSYSIEALDRLKQQGKIRFTGFGCHFTPELFLEAIDKFGDYFDIVSIPYNIRHRAAESVLAAAKKKDLGTITIKPFSRGELLKERELTGADAGLPRDMIAFVLENQHVDVCTCGLHSVAHVRENLSASWNRLTPTARQRLEIAAMTPCRSHRWLENDWRYA